MRWREAAVEANGYLDLRGLGETPDDAQNAIAFAQTWLHAPHDVTVAVTLGTDDGCRVHLNDQLMFHDPRPRGAGPDIGPDEL